MDQKSVAELGEQFGLTIENLSDSDSKAAYKIYKGAKHVFSGDEDAARNFLSTYKAERPALFEGSMYGYVE
ncbi:MAG: hypothetical protein ABI646_04065 [Acidobacteriota bacterium]